MKWTFTYETGDEDNDPGWTLDQAKQFSIQDARGYGGGFCVNEVRNEDDPKAWVMIHHAEFKQLAKAQDRVIALAREWMTRELAAKERECAAMFPTETTTAGVQLVIPGCEKPVKPTQGNLFEC